MDKKVLIIFALVSLFINVSESRMIVPRGLPEDESSGNGEMAMNPLENNRKLGLDPGIFDPLGGAGDLGGYDYDSGVNKPQRPPTDYDIHEPEEDSNGNDNNEPDEKPERFPSDGDRREPPIMKPIDEDEDADKKYDEEYPGEENDDSNKDDSLPAEENGDKPIHPEGDDSNIGEETDKEEGNDEESEEKEGEDEESEEKEGEDEESEEKEGEDEDKNDHIPDADDDENKHPEDENEEPEEHDNDEKSDEKPFDGEEAGFADSDGSIFDTPFFNIEQVKKYFGTLERALGQVFRQTVDEARLLNGTYANTTEEEVEIDGKKYIVQKSVIQGADNHSSIYVEALSSKPELNDTEEMKSNEMTNSTEV